MSKALVVLSGGQDSMTCLGVALQQFGVGNVEAISFNYGQRHEVELAAAEAICQEHGVPWRDVKIDFLSDLVTSALLESDTDIGAQHAYKQDLPASFVPNRNALFLTIAHAVAQEIGADSIFAGMCQTDYSGYPDCRERFIQLLEKTLNIGYETKISIITPMMHLTKAQTFALAEEVDFLEVIINQSVTCYNGVLDIMNDWGMGCGKCPACKLRAKGWDEYIKTK
jgi:7-cyano-7-deazaguanine synthase